MANHIYRFLASLLIMASVCVPERAVFADTVSSKWVKLSFTDPPAPPARGLLHTPDNNFGNLPAVLLIADCTGIKSFQKTWANLLASQGYVSFLLDPHRHYACQSPEALLPLLGAAKKHLYTLENMEIDQIAIVSWGSLPLSLTDRAIKDIVAAISFYPDCPPAYQHHNATPLLVLATQQSTCIGFLKNAITAGNDIHMRIYPLTSSGFDNPDVGISKTLGPLTGAYNLMAHQDAIKRVEAFLNKYLQVTLAQQYPSKAFSPLPPQLDRDETPRITYGYGTWTHDPTNPGPNRPPSGRSVFDWVFSHATATGTVYHLPDSYEQVIGRISEFLSLDRSGRSPIKQILIPRGRSLQREAARPNYYHHPRIVAAVDGEPAEKWKTPAIFLKDRLFLGYQETAKILEVISYNEAAARFEFQIVKNFGPGLKPTITYADRRLCTSCHQNGAPLFPREEWQETSASRSTNQQLQKVMKNYHGVPVGRRGEIPAAIDVATDRANLLPVLQRLWRQGCGDENNLKSNQCRASAFEAMLLYRLSNDNDFDRNNPVFNRRYTERLSRRWRQFWPGGLYISNADIPDRNPTKDASIYGLRDPLTPRPPLEIWSGFKRSDLERMIIAMAEDLPTNDIKKLDQWIVTNAKSRQPRSVDMKAACTLTRQLRRGLENPITLECTAKDLHIKGALTSWNNKTVAGEIINMRVNNFEILDQQSLIQVSTDGAYRKDFKLMLEGNHMRLADGRRLSRLSLHLHQETVSDTAEAEAILTIEDDFQPIRDALSEMTPIIFKDDPFQGPKKLSQLFYQLGVAHTKWCCAADRPGPPMELDKVAASAKVIQSMEPLKPTEVLERYCSRCHRTPNRVPPNFLLGDQKTVAVNINHCAPRMAFRLSMWDLAVDDQPRSPMPPENALPLFGLSKTQWRNSQELATLRQYVKSLLVTTDTKMPVYDDLRRCMNSQ